MTAPDQEYQHTGVVVSQKFLQEKPEMVERFLKGYLAGVWFMKTRKAETIKLLGEFMELKDQEALEEVYALYIDKYLAKVPYPTLNGIQVIIDLSNTAKDKVKPEQVADRTALEKLEKSGFVDQLWAKK